MPPSRRFTPLRLVATCLACALVGPATAQWHQANHPRGELRPYRVASGLLVNNAVGPATTVYTHRIDDKDKKDAWLRIYFGEVELAPGSFIRLTSLADGEVQELDAQTLAMWNNTSAYFNGGALDVELVAAPGTTNSLSIEQIASEDAAHPVGGAGTCGICDFDGRISTNQLWVARLLPLGCTASVYNETSCMVTAGHCLETVADVVEFNVPPSFGNAPENCAIVHPAIEHQFPVTSKLFHNELPCSVGDDWGVITTGINSEGLRPYDKYGRLRRLAVPLPVPGLRASVTGYGVDLTCEVSQTQRWDVGIVMGSFVDDHVCDEDTELDWWLEYTADITGGNSGSAILQNGRIIGIATHCFTGGCPNLGTRMDHPEFMVARAAVCCVQPATSTCCSGQNSPGCDDEVCRTNVCMCDPYCCDVEWDAFCAGDGHVAGCGAQNVFLCGHLCDCQDFCPDLNGDAFVNIADLKIVIGNFGLPDSPADLNGDGTVGWADLFIVLTRWMQYCE